MKVLGIDSSGMVASVAVVCDDTLVAEYKVNYKKTHSQTLLPMLDEVVRMTELDLEGIDAIAVAAGPGSFTGLRIGAATVKGLGMALDKPVISVPTCHALAYNMWGVSGLVCPIIDARRNQAYTGIYTFSDGKLDVIMDQDALDIMELIDIINKTDCEQVSFVGDGVNVFRDVLGQEINKKVQFAPAHMKEQSAASVATLGMEYFKEGKYESADDHKPIYLKKSQAEREREERLANQ